MIYVNQLDEPGNTGDKLHVWIESSVKDWQDEVFGTQHDPDVLAMCGYDLISNWDHLQEPYLVPATKAADSILDLLRYGDVCVECRIRASVYHGIPKRGCFPLFKLEPKSCNECRASSVRVTEIIGVGEEEVIRKVRCLNPDCKAEFMSSLLIETVEDWYSERREK